MRAGASITGAIALVIALSLLFSRKRPTSAPQLQSPLLDSASHRPSNVPLATPRRPSSEGSVAPSDTRDPAAILAHMALQTDTAFRAATSSTEALRCDELANHDPQLHWSDGVNVADA